MISTKLCDLKARQTRDDWQLVVTVELVGLNSKAHAAYLAGQLTGSMFSNGIKPPAEITNNFDEAP